MSKSIAFAMAAMTVVPFIASFEYDDQSIFRAIYILLYLIVLRLYGLDEERE